MSILGIILVVVILIAVFPAFPYNNGWGYRPFGGLLGIIVFLLILWFFFGGRFH